MASKKLGKRFAPLSQHLDIANKISHQHFSVIGCPCKKFQPATPTPATEVKVEPIAPEVVKPSAKTRAERPVDQADAAFRCDGVGKACNERTLSRLEWI